MIYHVFDAIEVIDPTRSVLTRAAQPFPTTLGTLEAIALRGRGQTGEDLMKAEQAVQAALSKRSKGGALVPVVVVDRTGVLRVLFRHDGAGLLMQRVPKHLPAEALGLRPRTTQP